MNEIFLYKNESVLSKPYETFGGEINVKVDLSSFATKTDLKNATRTDTFKLAAKSDLISPKVEADKLDINTFWFKQTK